MVWPGAVSALAALALFSSLTAVAQQSCAIAGRVVDDSGTPIPFAVVNALRSAAGGGRPESLLAANGSAANQRGEYCLRDLPPGDYLVRATARTRAPSSSPSCQECCDSMTELATTFYRSRRAPGYASLVSVGVRRNSSGVDIKMRRVPAYCVRGEVRDTRGSLDSQAAISVEQGSWSSGVLNEGGRFLLTGLTPGSYTIVILDRARLGRVLARRSIQVSAAHIEGLVITLPPGTRLPDLRHR